MIAPHRFARRGHRLAERLGFFDREVVVLFPSAMGLAYTLVSCRPLIDVSATPVPNHTSMAHENEPPAHVFERVVAEQRDVPHAAFDLDLLLLVGAVSSARPARAVGSGPRGPRHARRASSIGMGPDGCFERRRPPLPAIANTNASSDSPNATSAMSESVRVEKSIGSLLIRRGARPGPQESAV